MEELDDEQRFIRSYLLGELGPEGERVEERMLTDPDYFERVLTTEEELFDDFVFGDMSAPDRENFTKNLLTSPRQLNKLETTKALKTYSENEHGTGGWWIVNFTTEHKLGAAFALFALLLLGSFAGYRLLARDPLEKEFARLNGPAATSTQPGQSVYPVTLTPTLFRGPGAGDEKQLAIPSGTEVVLLNLALSGDDYTAYNVALGRGAEDRPLRVEGLKAVSADNAKVLPVRIPPRALTAGHHELTLSGVAADGRLDENIRTYTFLVAGDGR